MVDTLAPKKIFSQRDLDQSLIKPTPVGRSIMAPATNVLDASPALKTQVSLMDTPQPDYVIDKNQMFNMMQNIQRESASRVAETSGTVKSSEETIKEKQTGMRTERQETPQSESLVMRPVEYAAEGFEDKEITNPVVVGEKGPEMIVPTGNGKFSVLDAKTTQGMMVQPNQDEEMFKETIRKDEGLKLIPYKPDPTEKEYTIGYGHYGKFATDFYNKQKGEAKEIKITKEKAEELLDKDVKQRISEVNNLLPDFKSFPTSARDAIFSEYYRGSIAQSPKAVELINQGKYAEAAIEFLDNDEYRDAGKPGSPIPGIRTRMERVANELNKMAGGLGSKP